MDSSIAATNFIDPIGYQDSRLVGRIPLATADAAVRNVLAVNELVLADTLSVQDSIKFKIPHGFPGNQKNWIHQETIYGLLEKDEKAIAFHAGEIWQILITALQYGAGDFEKTMQFIVNYGRDNDTAAAVAGTILGAKNGYSNLPIELRAQVLRVNKEFLGIDLEAQALQLTDTYASMFSD